MKNSPGRPALLFVLSLFFGHCALAQKDKPYVLLVSFDGFRYDYVEKFDLPNFKAFIKEGSAASEIVPCYPSLTFPNHYSIVTGMYPGTHGLVDNSFYDPGMKKSYSMSDKKAVADTSFYGGVPLWTLARRNGIKSASYFWVGSEQSEEKLRPDYYFPYNTEVPFKDRIDQVIAWLKLPESERPHFITLYFSEPDHTSHEKGPWEQETKAVVQKMDSLLGYLMSGIKSTSLPVNTILVSDHGMSELPVEVESVVFLDEIFDIKSPSIKITSGGTIAHLYLKGEQQTDSLYQVLKKKEKNYTVYKAKDVPAQWHYVNKRVGDIIIVVSPYHQLRRGGRAALVANIKPGGKFGVHGYDPYVIKDVHGIFYAQGPNVRQGVPLKEVRNIDVYPFISAILGMKTPVIDGNFKNLKKIYKK